MRLTCEVQKTHNKKYTMATIRESRQLIEETIQAAREMQDLFAVQSRLCDVDEEKARMKEMLHRASSEEVVEICMNTTSMVKIFCNDIITKILEFVEQAGVDGQSVNCVCWSFRKAWLKNKRRQERMRRRAIERMFSKGKTWLVSEEDDILDVMANKVRCGDTIRLAAGEYIIHPAAECNVFKLKSMQIIGEGPMKSLVWMEEGVSEICKPTHWEGVSIYFCATECNIYDRLWMTNCRFGLEQYKMYFYGADDLDCKDVEFDGIQKDEERAEYFVGVRYEHDIWEDGNFNRPILRNCQFVGCGRPVSSM